MEVPIIAAKAITHIVRMENKHRKPTNDIRGHMTRDEKKGGKGKESRGLAKRGAQEAECCCQKSLIPK